MTEQLLSVRNLEAAFTTGRGLVRAVSDVSFDIRQGEVFALVGESGCGKSTTALSMMRLVPPPGRITGGEILLCGRDLPGAERRGHGRCPGQGSGDGLSEPAGRAQPRCTAPARRSRRRFSRRRPARGGLAAGGGGGYGDVRISDHAERSLSYPHELSGGMRQRVMTGMMIPLFAEAADCRHRQQPPTLLSRRRSSNCCWICGERTGWR